MLSEEAFSNVSSSLYYSKTDVRIHFIAAESFDRITHSHVMVFYRKGTRIIFNAVFKRIYRTSDRYAQADKGRIAHATNSKLLQTFPMCADK